MILAVSCQFVKQKLIKFCHIVKNYGMRRINLLLQEILKITLIFLLCFVWMRYFVRKFWISLVLSVALSILIYLAITLFFQRKQRKIGMKLKEKQDAENIFLSLATSPNAMEFFVEIAKKFGEKVTKHKEFVTIENSDKKTIIFANLTFEDLDNARFVEIYNKIRKEKPSKIIVLCHDVSDKNLSLFLKNFDEEILILNQYETYQKLYKESNLFPPITRKYALESKLKFKDYLNFSFNKKRTKGYLFSAFILILSGLFVKTTVFYCIVASLLIVFAILSQLNLFEKTSKAEKII